MRDRDRIILLKMIHYCDEIRGSHHYFHDDRALFYDSERGYIYRNAVTMPILQIGELAKSLSDTFKTDHQVIPWKEIAGMRDIFAHHYGSIDYEMVWNTSKKDINNLHKYCKQILNG